MFLMFSSRFMLFQTFLEKQISDGVCALFIYIGRSPDHSFMFEVDIICR